jgi:hypothetical protein
MRDISPVPKPITGAAPMRLIGACLLALLSLTTSPTAAAVFGRDSHGQETIHLPDPAAGVATADPATLAPPPD